MDEMLVAVRPGDLVSLGSSGQVALVIKDLLIGRHHVEMLVLVDGELFWLWKVLDSGPMKWWLSPENGRLTERICASPELRVVSRLTECEG